MGDRWTSGWTRRLCLAASLSLFATAAMAAGAGGVDHRLELGLGLHWSWAELSEIGTGTDPFTASDRPGFGGLIGLGWRFSERALLEVEGAGSRIDSSLEGVRIFSGTTLVGLRYHLLPSGPIRPYLRGAYGAAQASLEATDGDAVLDLKGKAALMGLGLRLGVSPRFRLDVEANHVVIGYDDDALVLENVYVGTRLDKAGSLTRIQLAARWLFW